MSRIMVCVPTVDMVDASFFTSCIGLRYDDGNRYSYNVKSNSLIYNARNEFVLEAINGKFDYVIMLDSDMVLPSETLKNLVMDIEETGADMVTGLYFRRRLPTQPVLYKEIDWYLDEKLGAQDISEVYEDYPKNSLFEIAGAGMGCAIMRVKMLLDVTVAFKMGPFTPLPRLSEDLVFCWRARKIGKKLMCDSRIKPLHAGLKLYGEADWMRQKEAEHA